MKRKQRQKLTTNNKQVIYTMGNAQAVINDNEKVEHLIKANLIDDPVIELFRGGIVDPKDIQIYISQIQEMDMNKKHVNVYNKNKHK